MLKKTLKTFCHWCWTIYGQACEFDYSGTQACKAQVDLKVILVNLVRNYYDDPGVADKTY